jgi:hypothetical protein
MFAMLNHLEPRLLPVSTAERQLKRAVAASVGRTCSDSGSGHDVLQFTVHLAIKAAPAIARFFLSRALRLDISCDKATTFSVLAARTMHIEHASNTQNNKECHKSDGMV